MGWNEKHTSDLHPLFLPLLPLLLPPGWGGDSQVGWFSGCWQSGVEGAKVRCSPAEVGGKVVLLGNVSDAAEGAAVSEEGFGRLGLGCLTSTGASVTCADHANT